MIQLNIEQRLLDKLHPDTGEALMKALKSTAHYILGMRDGSCYRYEAEIEEARDLASKLPLPAAAAADADIDYKKLLIDAICCREPADVAVCCKLEDLGYLKFIGNQHNERWAWLRARLEEHTVRALEKLYQKDYAWLIGS